MILYNLFLSVSSILFEREGKKYLIFLNLHLLVLITLIILITQYLFYLFYLCLFLFISLKYLKNESYNCCYSHYYYRVSILGYRLIYTYLL